MSSVYVLEPPTKGKVILNTNYGPLDIELWPKEAPKAVRNFVQLCLEGYYDNTIFHRIIKSFIVQGGDPSGTGTGGESIYGSVFSDEFHSRLRFKHRGIVACAGAGSANSNGSQFFITLDRCDSLDKKHTIFGKVTGDSIYNLLRLGEVETDKDDRPLDTPPKIISVEVLWDPFDDIVPRTAAVKSSLASKVDIDKNEPKKKATKNLSLLSFGEEAEEEEKDLEAINTRIKSSHDVLDDPRLLKEKDSSKNLSEINEKKEIQLSIRETLSSKKESEAGLPKSLDDSDDDDEANFDTRMRQQILKRRMELGDIPTRKNSQHDRSTPRRPEVSPPRSDVDTSDGKPMVQKLSLKKKGIGSDVRAERMAKADADLQLLGEAERERQFQKQKRRRRQGREDEVLAKLEKFKAKMKPNAFNGESENRNDDKMSDWMEVRLKFEPETGKDNMSRNEDLNDYVVHDPLLEKGKAKFNRMQAREKRREREWAGKSLT